MEDQKLNSGVNFDDEFSFLARLANNFKMTSYKIMDELLNGERVSFMTRTLMIIFEAIQILNFQFAPSLEHIWKNSSVTSPVTRIIRFTNIFPNLIDGSYETYQMVIYLASSLIAFLIFQLVLIIFSLDRKKGILQIPVSIMRIATELLSTVLYLPLFQLFISVFQCSAKEGSSLQYMTYFQEQQCYAGTHFTLSFLGGLFAFFVFLYSGLSSLLFYECRMVSEDCNSKLTSRGEFSFFIYKTLIILLIALLEKENYQILHIVFISLGSILMFDYYNLNLNHNHYWIAKFVSTLHIVNSWTSIMLILSYIAQYQAFESSITIWLIGLPLIIGISILRREYRIDILLTNTNSYDVLSQPLTELPYVTKLLNFYYTDKSIQILLEGFLDYHSWLCNKEECASKKKIAKTTKFSKEMRQKGESEKMIRLILAIKGMYYFALQRFPNNTYLRIMYSLFLLDKLLSKQQAMQELLNTEMEGPAFDEQFIIYRYKRIIENELKVSTHQTGGNQKNNKESNTEMVNELSISNHQDICRASIEKSANFHVEFWSQLSEDQPDLGKLSEIGFKISIVNQQAEEQWNKLLQINSYNPQLMRLYSRYKLEILNDREGGQKVINDINKTNQQSSKNQGFIDLTTDPKPTIVISAEDDQFGIITNANLAASGALGYHKVEVINRNIKVTMPYLYSEHHDKFIESYLQTLEARLLNMDRFVPAKSKSDYLVMIVAYVRHVPSLIHGTQFVGQFFIKNQKKIIGYILINLEGDIQNISTSCINMLLIDQKRLSKRTSNIEQCIENFMKNIEDFKSKNGANTKVKEFGKSAETFEANVSVTDVSLKIGVVGYIVSIEKLFPNGSQQQQQQQKQQQNNTLTAKKDQSQQNQIQQHLQFKIDPTIRAYYGELIQGTHSMIKDDTEERSVIFHSNLPAESCRDASVTVVNQLSKSFHQNANQSNIIVNKENNQDKDDKLNEIDEVKDYAKGIRCVRLIGSKLVDIEEFKQIEEEQEEELKEESEFVQTAIQQKEEEYEEESSNITNIFKRRDKFIKFIFESQFLKSKGLQWMQLYSIIFTLSAAALIIMTFFVVSNELQQAKQRYEYLSYSNQLSADGQIILAKIQQLYFLNKQIIDYNKDFEQIQRDDIQKYQSDLESLQISLESNTLGKSDGHYELLNKQVVNMSNKQAGQLEITHHNLNDATRQIISSSNNIQNMELNDFDSDQTQFYFLQSNLLNDYNIQLNNSTNYYAIELQSWVDEKEIVLDIQLLVIGLFTLFSFVLVFPFQVMINQSQRQVLQVFLDIPLSKVKKLYAQCESFLTSLQSGNDDEILTEMTDQGDIDDDHTLLKSRKGNRSRKIKINLRNQKKTYVPLGIAYLGLWGYYLLNYFMSTSYSNNLSQFIHEFNTTSTMENFLAFSSNNLKQMFIDETFLVRNIKSSDQVIFNIQEMYNINSVIQQEHSKNTNNHDSSYNDAYVSIWMSNCCTLLSDQKAVSLDECEKFMNGSAKQGLTVVITRFIEEYRRLKQQYDKLKLSGIDQTQFRKKINELINSQEMNDIVKAQDIYIKTLFRYLSNSFVQSISTQNDNIQGVRITILIVSLAYLLGIYLFIWVPILSNLNNNIEKVRQMILMIPLDICEEIKSIRNMLSSYIGNGYDDKVV